MSNRVLETILTGRNLLSPVLVQASREVTDYATKVTAANTRAAETATASAKAQTAAAATQTRAATEVAAANTRTAETAAASAATQTRAHTQVARSAAVSAADHEKSMARMSSGMDMADNSMRRMLGTMAAMTAGMAAIGAAAGTIKLGVAYQDSLNQVQAVTGATAAQMAAVRAETKALGADLSLPATSAADAALALNALAKGGLSVAQAMAAAKGTLQLAAAAQIDGATAADIQAAALKTFGLSADQAGRVADVLANTANMSAGSITDFAYGMQQAGNVASMFGLSVEDTAAALGIFANNGIKGSDAGTSLKTMLTALTDQGKPAQNAIADLGLTIYDQQGKFVGLASLADQLAAASKRMSAEQFQAAASTLFGTDAIRAASVFARTGAAQFNAFADGVARSGGAAKLSESYMKGLGGAWRGFVSTVENVQLNLFEKVAPGLEKLVRAATADLPKVIAWLGRVRDQGAAAMGALADYLSPVTSRLDDLWTSITRGDGMLASLWNLFKVGAGAAGALLQAAQPLVVVAGDLLGLFAKLPGPVQATIAVLTALKMLSSGSGIFGFLKRDTADMGGAMQSAVKSAEQARFSLAGFAQTVRANMSLASDEVSRLDRLGGGLSAGFQTYFPNATQAVSGFAGSVRYAYTEAKQLEQIRVTQAFGADAVGRATGDLKGLGAAARAAAVGGVGALRSAGGSLVGFLGGPWGLALAGAALVTSSYAADAQRAAQLTDKWTQSLVAGGAAAARFRAQAAQGDNASWGDRFSKAVLPDSWIPDRVMSQSTKDAIDASNAYGDASKAAEDYFRSLNPVDEAQARAAQWQGELNYRLKEYGSGSPEVEAAQRRYAYWTGIAADRSGQLTEASRTAAQNLLVQAQSSIGAANATLAASGAATAYQQQLEATRAVLADSAATDLEKKAAQDQLAQSTLQAAQAAGQAAYATSTARTEDGKAAEANAALLGSLKAMAQQMGADTPAAITQLIASLSQGMQSANATAQMMNALGIAVNGIPNNKSVIIDAPTEDQRKRLEALGYTVRTLPNGQVIVTADTSNALASLGSLFDFIARNRQQIVASTVAGSGSSGSGGRTFRQAAGGVLRAYADGGIEPMSAGVARVVPPNSLRIIGDRIADDEAYIPINGSARSKAILGLTANAMGYSLVPAVPAAGYTVAPAAQPGYGPAAAGAGIDYDRLAQAITRAMPASGSGPLVAVDTVQLVDGTPRDVATELAYTLRTRGR